MKDNDLFFIRHAESQLNRAYLNFLQEKNVQHKWEVLCGIPEFLEKVKYNQQYIDCSITQNGVQQCAKARPMIDSLDIDVILVSPLHRTLQTCENLFSGRKVPVFVEPLLSQALRSSCDISKDISEKISKYPDYKFSDTLINDDLWFLKFQPPEHQQKFNKILEGTTPQNHQQRCQKVLNFMRQTLIYQDPISLRKRSKVIKQLLKKYRQNYKKIAIVAHFCTINYTVSKEFNANNQPVSCNICNCGVHETNLQEIMKYD